MEIGALVVAGAGEDGGGDWARLRVPSWPVLGKSILEIWMAMVRGLGIELVSVVDRAPQEQTSVHTMLEWAKEGVEQVLLIVLGAYAEIDLSDVVRFHAKGQRRVTKVFDRHGPLGVSLLDRECILANHQWDNHEDGSLSRYDFLGYVARLSSSVNYRRLVEDALYGRCGIQPAGIQTRENVWIDKTTRVHASAQITAPCYIGPGTKIKAGVTIRGCSSVERNCEIDLGTTINHSSVLPNTYVAPGLYLRDCVVDGTRLEHLARGVAVDLGEAGLSARKASRGKRILRLRKMPSMPELLPPDANA